MSICDLYILVLILIIIFSIIYLCYSTQHSITNSAMIATVLGGVACSIAKQPLTGEDFQNSHIICDGTNIMHHYAEVMKKSIFNNADKADILRNIAKVLSKKFPNSPGIHIVTKNQNITAYNDVKFEETEFYNKYLAQEQDRINAAYVYAMNDINIHPYQSLYFNQIWEEYHKKINNDAYHYFLRDYLKWCKNNFEQWKLNKIQHIRDNTSMHLQEIVKISEQLLKKFGIKNVYFHLAYDNSIVIKNQVAHYIDSRDDVLAILLASNNIRPQKIDLSNSILVSMDYFRPNDTYLMHTVPEFSYLCIKDGILIHNETINKGGNELKDITGKVQEIAQKNKLVGYNLSNTHIDSTEYKQPFAYEQSTISRDAPVRCLYLNLSVKLSSDAKAWPTEERKIQPESYQITPDLTILENIEKGPNGDSSVINRDIPLQNIPLQNMNQKNNKDES